MKKSLKIELKMNKMEKKCKKIEEQSQKNFESEWNLSWEINLSAKENLKWVKSVENWSKSWKNIDMWAKIDQNHDKDHQKLSKNG